MSQLGTLMIFFVGLAAWYHISSSPTPKSFSGDEIELDLMELLPIIDEDGHLELNIPDLSVYEFFSSDEVFIRIRIVSAAIYFHYWLNLIKIDDALDRLCYLYRNFPIYCEAEEGYRQYNYTHCLDKSGNYVTSRYRECPVDFIAKSLHHQGKELAFGADYLYDIFVKLDIRLELKTGYDGNMYHEILMKTV